MYTLLVFIHVLALVYWLGGDLGTYISSQYVLREDLSVESRQTAFNIFAGMRYGAEIGYADYCRCRSASINYALGHVCPAIIGNRRVGGRRCLVGTHTRPAFV